MDGQKQKGGHSGPELAWDRARPSVPGRISAAPSSGFRGPTMLYNPNQILFGKAH